MHSSWMRHALALPLLVFAVALSAAGAPDVESRKIQYLIASIENLEDAQFIRNGKAYDAKQAADHLRRKLERAGERCNTAEAFIRHCASASSMSGKPYEIRFARGAPVTTEEFLRRKLSEFRPGSGAEHPTTR